MPDFPAAGLAAAFFTVGFLAGVLAPLFFATAAAALAAGFRTDGLAALAAGLFADAVATGFLAGALGAAVFVVVVFLAAGFPPAVFFAVPAIVFLPCSGDDMPPDDFGITYTIASIQSRKRRNAPCRAALWRRSGNLERSENSCTKIRQICFGR
jgi:hypothetical protein